jgi:hypothetical protein
MHSYFCSTPTRNTQFEKVHLQSKLACAQAAATERRNKRLQVMTVTSGGMGQTPRTNALEQKQYNRSKSYKHTLSNNNNEKINSPTTLSPKLVL